eukprot:TRINITY_DN1493_c0_g2_i1.p1 TRINITY_DN1493_c0_g2~~TRINITY_DN1493_c0_g2_i1.p1  ORF type:complete len:478 (-),score=54.16 TRINITY_DN1493_c0_g2_i1:560-1876(-)
MSILPNDMRMEALKRMKESVSIHKTGLPRKLLEMFQARPEIQYSKPPTKKPPKLPYSGLADYVKAFAEPGDKEYEPEPPEGVPPSPRQFRNRELAVQCRLESETFTERKQRLRKQRLQESQKKLEQYIAQWDPKKDPNVTQDEYKTLFVARLAPAMTEKKLSKELSEFGPIRRVRIVKDKKGRSRGYAFIEFEHKSDLKVAYKMADGRKLENQRILVDVERGRTVPGWKPRRLGGGLGGTPKPATAADRDRDRRREEERGVRPRREERTRTPERDREREREVRDRRDVRERERPRDVPRRDRDEREVVNGDRYGNRRQESSRRRSRSRDREREMRPEYGRGGGMMDYGAGNARDSRDFRAGGLGMNSDYRRYGGGEYDRSERDRDRDRDRKRGREQQPNENDYKEFKRNRRSGSAEQPEEGEVVEPSRRDRRRERDQI